MKKNLLFIAVALMAMLNFIPPGYAQFSEDNNDKPQKVDFTVKDDTEMLWGFNWEEPQLSENAIISTLFGGLPEPGHVVTADDIVVPEGKVWTITSIWARGRISVDELGNPWAFPNGFGVRVYEDDNDNPGDLIIDHLVISYDFDYTQPEINLPTPLELNEGKYWIAVYGYFANSTDFHQGMWFQHMWNPEPSVESDARLRDYANQFGMEYQGWIILEEILYTPYTALDFALWGTETEVIPEIFNVTFNVNILASGFNPDLHEVYIAGSFGGELNWVEPGTHPDLMLERVDDTMIFTLTLELEAGEYEYKYFSTLIGEGWYGGEWQGYPHRSVSVNDDMVLHDVWYASNHSVTFYLDMENAEDFNPDSDVVYITGSMFDWAEPGSVVYFQAMNRIGSTMIWKKSLLLQSGDYSYKYFLNEGWDGAEWDDDPDRQITILSATIIENTWGVPEGGTFIDSSESVFTQLFPNPADGFINIQTNSVINRIRIIDVTGRIVFMRQYDHSSVQIPVNSFEAGLYVVQIYTLDGLMTRKLMVN